jgi:hypothetical protein
MKLIPKNLIIAAIAASFATTVTTQTSHAGQWLDSLFGRRQPAYPVGQPVPLNGQVLAYSPGAYPSSGYIPPSYANLRSPQTLGFGSYATPPANNAPLFAPGFPQTVAAQLPTAAYDTQWARTPVTYYRPVTAFDPRYGTTVTSLQPCTSYQYQALRQPVIAPRPMLGEYGLQANRWPSITGPGYNPTGLANAAMTQPIPQVQSIPYAGMPFSNQPNTFAPTGGSGVSSGMPASTLPVTTMPYNPAFANAVNVAPQYAGPAYAGQAYAGQAYAGQAYAGQAYAGQQASNNGLNFNGQVISNPAYATSYSGAPNMGWPTAAIGSGVVPTAAWMPSSNNCVNGQCYSAAGQLAPPNIPGAVSVSPVGPPAYSATPNPSNGSGGFVQPTNSNTGFGSTSGPGYSNPYGAPVMPNSQVLPPGASYNDPEAERRPNMGGQNVYSPPATKSIESPFIVQNIPMVAIDRESSKKSQETLPNSPNRDESSKTSDAIASNDRPSNETMPTVPSLFGKTLEIPQTLPPRANYGMKPLSAPDDFDSKPRWNPTLLDPEDRTVMERGGRLSPIRTNANTRIRLVEDGNTTVSAVAMDSKKPNRSAIQLVSGVETVKPESTGGSESESIRFRPVTSLK